MYSKNIIDLLACYLFFFSFSKLLERIACEKLMKFLITKDILYKHQYGLSPKHSTIHRIIHLLNHCTTYMPEPDPEYPLTVLWDLSKAFDVINHEIVLKKMNNYRIRGIAHDWYEMYLSDRQQFVEVGGKVPITIG